jgi:uncharacterized protein YciI
VSFLVVLRPARDGIESEAEMLEAHWDYLGRRHADGELVVAGPSWTGDDPFGVPAVTSGAMRAETRPLRIVTR